MEGLFNLHNWADLLGDRSFWNAAAILLLFGAALSAALFSDRIHQWHAERLERNKWLQWNR